MRHNDPLRPGSFTKVPSSARTLKPRASAGTSQPFSCNSDTHKPRSQPSAFCNRFISATSETAAMPAAFALTTVSRSEYPLPTCSSSVRSRFEVLEKPRRRSQAPLNTAWSCHSAGNRPSSRLQSSSRGCMPQRNALIKTNQCLSYRLWASWPVHPSAARTALVGHASACHPSAARTLLPPRFPSPFHRASKVCALCRPASSGTNQHVGRMRAACLLARSVVALRVRNRMLDTPSRPPEEFPEDHEPIVVSPAPAFEVAAVAASAPPKKAKPAHRRRLWLWILVLFLLGLGGYLVWAKITAKQAADAAAKVAAKGPPPIPVVAATSRKGDIGVYYSGLGAVTPLAVVTLKTRVDGQLMSVRYREGDTVHQGDLLVEIDDRPYQAALTQAERAVLRDQIR